MRDGAVEGAWMWTTSLAVEGEGFPQDGFFYNIPNTHKCNATFMCQIS